MKNNIFEIYQTTPHIEGEEWLKLILKVSQINGLFKHWNLWVHIENNIVRYFIETKRMLPPILGNLGDFLIRKSDINLKKKWNFGIPFILTNHYKTFLDVYDRFETRKSEKIKNIKIMIFPHNHHNYLSTTHLYLENEEEKIVNRKLFLNSSIYNFVSIDFDTHVRFFYQKNEDKYLDTKKVMNVLTSDKENAIIEADVFPYLQDKLYLNYKNYDFDKHSIVIGSSGTGKSKLICSLIKKLSQSKSNKMKYKVIVIDPHSAIEDDIGGLEDTDVIDFKTEESSVNMFVNSTDDIISEVESIMSIFKNIIADRIQN